MTLTTIINQSTLQFVTCLSYSFSFYFFTLTFALLCSCLKTGFWFHYYFKCCLNQINKFSHVLENVIVPTLPESPYEVKYYILWTIRLTHYSNLCLKVEEL